MEKIGTNYGGWFITKNIPLTSESIIYSAGVGEDISFDLLLSDKYNCNIFLIDPTKRAKKHYHEILDYYDSKDWRFSGVTIESYYDPPRENVHYIRVGSPEEAREKMSQITEEEWTKMSQVCYEWYQRNVHSDQCWRTMIEYLLYVATK